MDRAARKQLARKHAGKQVRQKQEQQANRQTKPTSTQASRQARLKQTDRKGCKQQRQASKLDSKCLNRLKQFAADERTSTESLMEIAGFVLVIPDQDLADIVLEVNSRKDGNRPALYLLHKRFQ